jgi:hypothetical protein
MKKVLNLTIIALAVLVFVALFALALNLSAATAYATQTVCENTLKEYTSRTSFVSHSGTTFTLDDYVASFVTGTGLLTM